ncbi:hypothetical protein SCAZ3_01430 [Streptococcus canis FSL Z3-227]|uniref:Uncharacterized protein n=1 Tax=Streptococcus canis FSL Z3-227 TaxID=482234 RepID=A0AAV3FPZ0_STRCB|nr:hypothetical protein SCAZ3_01430 [Streptococcus canis FSL Z3-227]
MLVFYWLQFILKDKVTTKVTDELTVLQLGKRVDRPWENDYASKKDH